MSLQNILEFITNHSLPQVGIFDEAFKSRIQLALHYKNLNLTQRHTIWQNFITRLESLDEPMDLEDIRKHIDDLAKSPMNGRQIRNCITTARQLARFKQKPMDYETLKHVIKVSQRFDNSLERGP